MPTAKREERKMEVTAASCDSYALPRSHLPFPPFLSLSGGLAINNGGKRKRSSRQLGLGRKRAGRGISGAAAASRQEQQGERKGGRKEREGVGFGLCNII